MSSSLVISSKLKRMQNSILRATYHFLELQENHCFLTSPLRKPTALLFLTTDSASNTCGRYLYTSFYFIGLSQHLKCSFVSLHYPKKIQVLWYWRIRRHHESTTEAFSKYVTKPNSGLYFFHSPRNIFNITIICNTF